MEVNRLSRETGHYVLDGVMSVIDVENWKGYEDTSMTAKIQVCTDVSVSISHTSIVSKLAQFSSYSIQCLSSSLQLVTLKRLLGVIIY